METEIKQKIEAVASCLDCQFHLVIDDADPTDWFNDDDEAVVCTKMSNGKQDMSSKWLSDMSKFKVVAGSCRPYRTRKEAVVPKWCPLPDSEKPVAKQ